MKGGLDNSNIVAHMLKFGVFTVFFQRSVRPPSTDCYQYYLKSVNLLPALLETAPPTILSTSSSSSANVIYYVHIFFKPIEHKTKLNRDKRSQPSYLQCQLPVAPRPLYEVRCVRTQYHLIICGYGQ